jgi:hypothetical protein
MARRRPVGMFHKNEGPQRRRSDRFIINAHENWYRDVWLLIITLVVLYTAIQISSTSNRISEGRHFALSTSCAVESAVAAQGRDVILHSSPPTDTPLFRFLERHGYPPLKARLAQQRIEARAYVQGIAEAVQASTGVKGKSLVRADGSLDCKRFSRLANAR